MNRHCAKFYTNAYSNVDIWHIFSFFFLQFLHKNGLFCPLMSNLSHIKPWTIAYILYKVMEYPCANSFTFWSFKYKFYKHFEISRDFCITMDYFALKCLILDLLSLTLLLISFKRLWTILVQNCTLFDP